MYDDEMPLGRAENLAGKKFGRLTALYRVKRKRGTYWKCSCDCGNIVSVRSDRLKLGTTQSCGCYGKEQRKKANTKDLTNQRFGKLVALYIDTNQESHYGGNIWVCKCDCGNVIKVPTNSLTTGNTQSCGCLNKHNLLGKRFGRLIALEYIKGDHIKHGKYKCICDCGQECYVTTYDLESGHTLSCGCLQKEKASDTNFIDISNQRFGKLIALYPINKGNNESILWHCKCDCGNECNRLGYSLRKGYAHSCGCLKSLGESKITQLLQNANIDFISQKTFETCLLPDTQNKALFDFYVNNTYLLEYDGNIHFLEGITNSGWNNQINFQKRQLSDTYKNQWCKENNIPLIRIPYTKLDTLCIEDLLLETTQFRVV